VLRCDVSKVTHQLDDLSWSMEELEVGDPTHREARIAELRLSEQVGFRVTERRVVTLAVDLDDQRTVRANEVDTAVPSISAKVDLPPHRR
jgi:hypothetical protein